VVVCEAIQRLIDQNFATVRLAEGARKPLIRSDRHPQAPGIQAVIDESLPLGLRNTSPSGTCSRPGPPRPVARPNHRRDSNSNMPGFELCPRWVPAVEVYRIGFASTEADGLGSQQVKPPRADIGNRSRVVWGIAKVRNVSTMGSQSFQQFTSPHTSAILTTWGKSCRTPTKTVTRRSWSVAGRGTWSRWQASTPPAAAPSVRRLDEVRRQQIQHMEDVLLGKAPMPVDLTAKLGSRLVN
jgi:hypothetical protein